MNNIKTKPLLEPYYFPCNDCGNCIKCGVYGMEFQCVVEMMKSLKEIENNRK